MSQGHNHADHAGMTHAEWLRYSNQGATRNDPLHPSLIEAMSFLPQMGIQMNVVSGGQEPAGQGGARTGSTRHDHGMAADVDFYKDGRKLDWNNADDLPILVQIVQTAKARGVTGIGAGDDYMGPGRFHVGFGNPGVWGAGGKGANAPEWLRAAYAGAPAGRVPNPSAPQSGMEADGPGRIDRNPARLAWAYANGKMTPEDAAIYERGMAEGMFPKADKPKQPDPLETYAAVAMRPRLPFQPVALDASPIRNSTPFGRS
jgi:hypothetical protein